MGLKDIIITPIYIILFTAIAYFIRPYVTNAATRKYFLPSLWVRFAGAIFLGLIYQFYYDGGDTFSYWTHGSQWIWKAFLEDPITALHMIFGPNELSPENFKYAKHIWFFYDSDSYFVVRIAGLFDIFTFGTYTSSAIFFAIFSWSGAWSLYWKIDNRYQGQSLKFAIIILFVPSVVFWGSGLLKDSLSLGSFCWLAYSLLNIADSKKIKIKTLIVLIISVWLIINIKPYIFYCAIPPAALWIYLVQIKKIRTSFLKILAGPIILFFFVLSSYLSIDFLTKESSYYSLDNFAKRAWITAYDIRYYTGKNAGSGYSLGEQDGTIENMVKLLPEAIFVSLYRPFLWEVRNPFMMLMSIESFILLLLTFRFFGKESLWKIFNDPFLVFCLSFSILFGFAVGVSTYNFGTLMRYKIPMMSLFLIFITVSRREARDLENKNRVHI
ncbi:hypothetical protein [Ekhidna sp.]